MKKLFTLRFNTIDLIGCAVMCILLSQGQWVTALASGIAMAGLSIIGTNVYGKKARDWQWQQIAKTGDYVGALRKYRQLYNSTLVDAQKAVDPYMGRKPR